MPTPVKAITYVAGIHQRAVPVVQPTRVDVKALTATAMRLMPPNWKPIRHAAPQLRARTILIPRRIYTDAFIHLKMTLFWRDGSRRPKRGQLWPRTR